MSERGAPTLVCVQLVKVYRGETEEVQALRGVDLSLVPGSLTAVLGPSGSGKSSLLRLLAGLDRASAGSITSGGTVLGELSTAGLRRWRRDVAYVHQRPRSNLLEHLTAGQHVRLAVRRRRERVDAEQALASLGLHDLADHRVDELSGGEQQRLAILAALLSRPRLLLADEPTAHLDDVAADAVLTRLRRAADEDATTVVLATHDPRLTARADRLLHLEHGVLTSEHDVGSATRHGVIDASGRLQLPPEARALFPGDRVRITVEDGAVTLRPPDRP